MNKNPKKKHHKQKKTHQNIGVRTKTFWLG